MLTQTTILIILFAITALSLIFTAGVWIYQHSLSSKINELEQEIEKKAQEFDIIKKEHNTILHPQPIINFSDEPVTENNTPEYNANAGMNNQIQIIRNVRGSFQTATDSTEMANPIFDHTSNISPTDSPNDIMEIVEDKEPVQHPSNPAVLSLYSDTHKDADFNQLWQQISTILSSGKNQTIIIDFAGINFLYEKELKYLLKISQITISQGSNLSFINCDTDLISIMQNYPQLLSFSRTV